MILKKLRKYLHSVRIVIYKWFFFWRSEEYFFFSWTFIIKIIYFNASYNKILISPCEIHFCLNFPSMWNIKDSIKPISWCFSKFTNYFQKTVVTLLDFFSTKKTKCNIFLNTKKVVSKTCPSKFTKYFLLWDFIVHVLSISFTFTATF